MNTRPALVIVLAVGLGACGGGSPEAAEPPCVVDVETMASILDRDEVIAAPQDNGLDCVYASEGLPVATVSVRTPEQFEAERARFEDMGAILPELVAETGFKGEATVDPRYNSLNVEAAGSIVSVEVVDLEPRDEAGQLELEKSIARAAVDALVA
jgi:hypothetical protein